MVVLTIVAQENREPIYFEDPIPKVRFMKLISCSLFNSWDTLKKEGSAALGDIQNPKGKSISKILPGHYNLESLAKEIDSLFAKYKYDLETETNTPLGQLVIKNTGRKPIELDRDLARLLGSGRDVLARFDITGKPFEKVSYHGSPQQVLRDCSTDEFINSITLSIKDEKGKLFDFNGFAMEFELELK